MPETRKRISVAENRRRSWEEIKIPLEKLCAACLATKPSSEFSRKKSEKSGLRSRCKECEAEAERLYAARNPGARSASTTKWQAKHPEKVARYKIVSSQNYRPKAKEIMRRRYAERRDEIRASDRKRYATDREYKAKLCESSRESYERRSEAVKAYQRQYRSEHPDRVAALANQARARKASAPGRTTDREWGEILAYFNHCCAYCLGHESVVGKMTRDHMRPLTRQGSNWPENLVPACKSCNSKKHNKTPLEFAPFCCAA